MEFRCHGLEEYGLKLSPNGSAGYEELLAGIQRQIETTQLASQPQFNPFRNPVPERDSASAAILINGSGHGIAALRFVWEYHDEGGGTLIRSGSVFAGAPMGFPLDHLQSGGEMARMVPAAVAPGGKRYLLSGYALGDSRNAAAARRYFKILEYSEVAEHGSAAGAARAELRLDGVFFADGAFAGANRCHLWEQVVFAAEERKAIGELARRRFDAGIAAEEVLEEIAVRTGPPSGPQDRPPRVTPGRDHPEAYRAAARRKIAGWLTGTQTLMGAEFALRGAIPWADLTSPFRRV